MLEKGIYILMKNYFSELQKDTKSTTYRRRQDKSINKRRKNLTVLSLDFETE